MLVHASELIGSRVAGMDGASGRLSDIFFDDRTWVVMFWVITLGKGKSAHAVVVEQQDSDLFNPESRELHLKRSVQNIHEAVSASQVLPVAKQRHHCPKPSIALPYLQSASSLKGYSCTVDSSPVGTVSDILIQANSWVIPYLQLCDTAGKQSVLMNLPTETIERLSTIAQRVQLRRFTPVKLQDDSLPVLAQPFFPGLEMLSNALPDKVG